MKLKQRSIRLLSLTIVLIACVAIATGVLASAAAEKEKKKPKEESQLNWKVDKQDIKEGNKGQAKKNLKAKVQEKSEVTETLDDLDEDVAASKAPGVRPEKFDSIEP